MPEASVAAASIVGRRSGPAQKAWNERVEKRVAVTANMLGDMKAVKMLGLSSVFSIIINDLRKVEIRTSEKFRYLQLWQILAGNVPITLAPFATFSAYAIIAVVRKDETLLSAQAFASLSLISLVTTPLLLFCQALPACMQAVACFSRIESYCSRQALGPSLPSSLLPEEPADGSWEIGTPLSDLRSPPLSSRRPDAVLASFVSANISWLPDATEPVLRDLNLTIRSGLIAITGPVGSGKSTLLETLVGETTVIQGSVVTNLPGAAFCTQVPWIMNDTIQRNITGDLGFDQKWYDFTVISCGLQRDLDNLVGGDQTIAGSNGSSLSGGQRQRVACATKHISDSKSHIYTD